MTIGIVVFGPTRSGKVWLMKAQATDIQRFGQRIPPRMSLHLYVNSQISGTHCHSTQYCLLFPPSRSCAALLLTFIATPDYDAVQQGTHSIMTKRPRTKSLTNTSELEGVISSPTESSTTPVLTPSTPDDERNASKLQHLDTPGSIAGGRARIVCSLPPHQPHEFATYIEHETHYRKFHTNRCHECQKNFPSDHYLDLHIAENHDPLNDAKRDKGEKTYGCFVNGCDKVCLTPQRRRWHCLAKHEFPKTYDFFIVNDGIDKRNSMLRPEFRHIKKVSQSTGASRSPGNDKPPVAAGGLNSSTSALDEHVAAGNAVDHRTADSDVEKVTESLSALKFLPYSVRFGRGRGRGGLARS